MASSLSLGATEYLAAWRPGVSRRGEGKLRSRERTKGTQEWVCGWSILNDHLRDEWLDARVNLPTRDEEGKANAFERTPILPRSHFGQRQLGNDESWSKFVCSVAFFSLTLLHYSAMLLVDNSRVESGNEQNEITCWRIYLMRTKWMEISSKALCKLRFLFFLSFAGSPLCGQVESDESFVGIATASTHDYQSVAVDRFGRIVVGSHNRYGPGFTPVQATLDGLSFPMPNPCRFEADGTPSGTFLPPFSDAGVLDLAIDRKQRLLVLYEPDKNVPELTRLIRMNDDDTVDTSFTPPIEGAKMILIDEKDRIGTGRFFPSGG